MDQDAALPCDTVFILGAGFSFDAGIPLMSGFVDRMWDLAVRQRADGKPLAPADAEVLQDAMGVRSELNEYHGRASFDDRNIEDILSILSFNEYLPARGRRSRLATFSRAIGRTIELSCSVKHPGVDPKGSGRVIADGPELYRDFWKRYLGLAKQRGSLPALITFNYDLVLERSLLQVAIGKHFNQYDNPVPARRVQLRYHHDGIDVPTYQFDYATYGRSVGKSTDGTVLKVAVDDGTNKRALEIDLLKLHGSLNFPAPRSDSAKRAFALTEALHDPFILPPIFNKQSTSQQRNVWRVAMERLRNAKHVVVVGYSLPRTDIYMQYFLKAALGPNINLSRIFVFDPALYAGKKAGDDMMARYAECFAPQLRDRICFRPHELGASIGSTAQGTAAHFVNALQDAPDQLVF